MVNPNTQHGFTVIGGTSVAPEPEQSSDPSLPTFPSDLPSDTTVSREPARVSDPIVASFLRNLRNENAPVTEVYYCASGLVRIYTEVDSKSTSALNKVYRAEAATQREFAKSGRELVPLVFEHRNRAFGGGEIRDEFLGSGKFIRVW